MKKIKSLLIVDIETCGFSNFDSIIEAGWCIYDVEHKKIKACGSTLFKKEENALERYNKISPRHTNGCPSDVKKFYEYPINNFKYDYVVAHNKSFDKRFLDSEGIRFKKPWICSYRDIDWPTNDKKLTLMAIELGVPIISAHRAIDDCRILADCLSKLPDLEGSLLNAVEPYRLFYADIDFENKDLAKKAGFKFDKERKQWVKKVKDSESFTFDFIVKELKDEE